MGYQHGSIRGRGRVKCEVCGKPLRDHKLTEQCPELKGAKLTISRPRRQKRADRSTTAPDVEKA